MLGLRKSNYQGYACKQYQLSKEFNRPAKLF